MRICTITNLSYFRKHFSGLEVKSIWLIVELDKEQLVKEQQPALLAEPASKKPRI